MGEISLMFSMTYTPHLITQQGLMIEIWEEEYPNLDSSSSYPYHQTLPSYQMGSISLMFSMTYAPHLITRYGLMIGTEEGNNPDR